MRAYNMPNLGKFKSVENYDGKPNQFLIRFEKGEVLQSYESVIVAMVYDLRNTVGRIYIGQDWECSKTTGKYRNMFLSEDKKETQGHIDSGKYKLLNI